MTTAKRVALYVRVSTSDRTRENQKRELCAWARAAGHKVVCVFEDSGISGACARLLKEGRTDAIREAHDEVLPRRGRARFRARVGSGS